MIAAWWTFIINHSIEFSIAMVGVYAVWRLVERSVSPKWGYLLFLVLGLKLVVPGIVQIPVLPVPVPETFTAKPDESQAVPNMLVPNQPEDSGKRVNKQPTVPLNQKIASDRQEGRESVQPSAPPVIAYTHKRSEIPQRSTSGQPTDMNAVTQAGLNRTVEAEKQEPEISSIVLPSRISLSYLLFAIWLAGVMVLVVREIKCHIRLRSLIRDCPVLRSEEIGLELDRLAFSVLRRRKSIRWIIADWARSPMTYGFWKPVIIVPPDLEESVPNPQLRWILMHELAHIRRGDYIVNLFLRMIRIVYFFHPLVWWYDRQVNALREYACDEEATQKSASSIRDCCEGLLSIAALCNGLRIQFKPASAGIHSETFLRRRLMKMINKQNSIDKQPQRFALPVMLLAFVFVTVFSFSSMVSAQAPQDAVEPQEAVKPVAPVGSSPAALDDIKKILQTPHRIVLEESVPAAGFTNCMFESSDGDIILKTVTGAGSDRIAVLMVLEVRNQFGIAVSEEIHEQVAQRLEIVKENGSADRFYRATRLDDNDLEKLNIDLTIYALIPANLPVTAESRDGDILAEGFEAAVNANTEDGDVIMKRCGGAIHAHSQDGDIIVSDSGGTVNAMTEDGDVIVSKCAGVIHAETHDGDVIVSGSSNRVTAKTEDGDVTISDSAGPVAAESKDGDVTLKKVAECQSAVTVDGDVTVILSKPPTSGFTCESVDGDVTIKMPKESKVTLDAQVSEDGDIVVNVNQYEGNSSETELHGTLNGGGPTIKLRSVEGTISINNE